LGFLRFYAPSIPELSSNNYNKRIAARLTEEMIKLTKEDGASEMYVSATPSETAVGLLPESRF
jgi:hypothetical protein